MLQKTFLRQNVGRYTLKPFWVSFGHFFPHKMWKGAFVREGAFIRINTVIASAVVDENYNDGKT